MDSFALKEASMLRKALAAAAIAGAVLLAACETAPTPYQPGGGSQPGYSETRIENNRYRITFKGNSATGKETVETYMLYRAAELTLQNGYDNFTVAYRATDKDKDVRSYGGYYGYGVPYYYPYSYWGWGLWDPYWGAERYRSVTSYEANVEILMGRGAKSEDPNAFDAREVSQNLGDKIERAPR
jgi:hypothetical protein